MQSLISTSVVFSILIFAGEALAWHELHYFTKASCAPCVPVTRIVNALNANDRDITVHTWEKDKAAFEFYRVDWLPAFVIVENGKKTKHYVQENGIRFNASFVSGLAPFKAKQLDPPPRPDCANPIGKVIKNLIPPPPAPGLPADVPDRIKVKRIEDLEAKLLEQSESIEALLAQVREVQKQIEQLESTGKGKDGQDGKQGPPGKDGRDGKDADSMPIEVLIEVIDDAGKVIDTKEKTYPRGTPLVFRFHEKLLTVQK